MAGTAILCRTQILLLLFCFFLLAAARVRSQSSDAVVMLRRDTILFSAGLFQCPVAVVGPEESVNPLSLHDSDPLSRSKLLDNREVSTMVNVIKNGDMNTGTDSGSGMVVLLGRNTTLFSAGRFQCPIDVVGLEQSVNSLSLHNSDPLLPSTLLDEREVPDFSTRVNVIKNGDVNTGTYSGSGTINSLSIWGFAILCLVIVAISVFCLRRDKLVERSTHVTGSSHGETRGTDTMKSNPHIVLRIVTDDGLELSVQVLKNATDDFNEQNIIGRGGFGTVYKGELHNGTKIAVKRMKPERMSGEGLELLKSEISAHGKVIHVNLVKLLGYCLEGSERLLVSELMTQGTLDRFLFRWSDEGLKPLEWRKRLGIALDVARGVEYLHSFAIQNFIHLDLKPSNILLGDDMRAKIADFGLVRQVPPDEEASASAKFVGTFGYIAPEYAVTGRVSRKTDVYSFGVVLMELITGRKAIDMTLPNEKRYIVAWFRSMKGNALITAIDPNLDLNDQETMSSIINVAELAGRCTTGEPKWRPGMIYVVSVLSSLVEGWKPTEPADPQDSHGINNSMTLAEMVQG